MTDFFSIKNIIMLAGAGLILFFGIFALRGVIKLVWKVLRVGLILFAIAILAGALFGYLDISFL